MSNDTITNEAKENARVEYAVANDVYMHYDNFAWQVGSVLLVGVFAYWGFIISTPPALLALLLGNLLVCFLMSIWLLYTAHNRQLYKFKLDRIYELETFLGMEQHTRFTCCDGKKRIYRSSWPSGHLLDACVYVIVSIGGLLPGINKIKREDWTWSALLVFALTIIIMAVILLRTYIIGVNTTLCISQNTNRNKLS